jgi:2-haloacid dehalogenase
MSHGVMSGRPSAILLDLLMATMDSMRTWSSVAGDRARGLAWRDAVTERMVIAAHYVPYEGLVEAAAAELQLPPDAPDRLLSAWKRMRRWPDADALDRLDVPYAFVTNCSSELAAAAVERSRLRPAFTLSAEEAGCYKPHPEIYRRACMRMEAEVDQTRYVAGAAYDARGASNFGLRAFLVARRVAQEQLPGAVTVVASLAEALTGL